MSLHFLRNFFLFVATASTNILFYCFYLYQVQFQISETMLENE